MDVSFLPCLDVMDVSSLPPCREQDHLRDDYMDKRRRLFSSDVDTVTVGQAGLLVELKLANDNLRWRLQQKQLANLAQKAIIVHLQVVLSIHSCTYLLACSLSSAVSLSHPRSVSSKPKRASRSETRMIYQTLPPHSSGHSITEGRT